METNSPTSHTFLNQSLFRLNHIKKAEKHGRKSRARKKTVFGFVVKNFYNLLDLIPDRHHKTMPEGKCK